MSFSFLKRKTFWISVVAVVIISYLCVIISAVGIFGVVQRKFHFKFSADSNISQSIKNNYISLTKEVDIDAELQKSAIIVSGKANVNKPVNKDAVFLGEKVTFNAPVGHNLYFVGEELNLNSTIGNNLYGSATDLNISKDAVISNDVKFSIEGDMILDGTILGDVEIESNGDVYINGTISGDIKILADNVYVKGILEGDSDITAYDEVIISGTTKDTLSLDTDKIEISKDAKVTNLKYNANEIEIADEIEGTFKVEEVSVDDIKKPDLDSDFERDINISSDATDISSFFAQVFFAFLIIFFARNFMKRVKDYVFEEPVNAFKKGAWSQFLLVMAIILGFISLIGIPIAILVILFTGFIWFLSASVNASVIAIFLKEKYPDKLKVNEYIIALMVIGGWTFLSQFILFSGFITFIFTLITFGGIYKIYNSKEIEEKIEDAEIK